MKMRGRMRVGIGLMKMVKRRMRRMRMKMRKRVRVGLIKMVKTRMRRMGMKMRMAITNGANDEDEDEGMKALFRR